MVTEPPRGLSELAGVQAQWSNWDATSFQRTAHQRQVPACEATHRGTTIRTMTLVARASLGSLPKLNRAQPA